jgi:replicative DNA helicase
VEECSVLEIPSLHSVIATSDDVATSRGANTGPDDRVVSGGKFILDRPDSTPAVWGHDNQVLWAEGEALMIAGEQGVGKTTLAGQLIRARMGVRPQVLDLPVKPGEGRVLYLAMDRPQQTGRSLHRQFGASDRELLDSRLVVWPGPLDTDVTHDPEVLRRLAEMYGADTVVIDSLKDIVPGLTNEDAALAYNRARQLATQNGAQLLELHHNTKKSVAQGAVAPLQGIYGSVWLTAGVGSAVMLDGSPGEALVTLRHLKQPAAEVGPLRLLHNHATGTTVVHDGDDLLAAARNGPITAREAARQLYAVESPEPKHIEKARRTLQQYVAKGDLREEQQHGSSTKVWVSPHREFSAGERNA